VSKGPKPLQAGRLPQKPPPRRGKGASPLATGTAKARGGTSIGGKPNGDGEVSEIPSSETPRGKKAASAAPIAEAPVKPRKLSAREVDERKNRFNDAYGRKRMLEREKKNVTTDLSREIKKLGKECDDLHDEIKRGTELLRQGELPLGEAAELQAGAKTPTPGETAQALSEIKKRLPNEPAQKIDRAQAGPTRIEAARTPADDIEAAVAADTGGAHA
jgi:hypothetical protein